MRQLLLRKTGLLFVCILSVFAVSAQSIGDIRINEILVYNTDGLRDDYGRTTGWIELRNTGYGKVNVGGACLRVRGKEYRIPQGDPKTALGSQGYILFYTGGDTDKGTFYTNFKLEDTDYIVFCGPGNKKEVIDSLYFNRANMIENLSFGWFKDHDGIEKLMNLPSSTPRASNNTSNNVPRSELFRQADPSGLVLTVTAITIVAIALTLLYFIFKYMGKFHIRVTKKREMRVIAAKTGTAMPVRQEVMTREELVVIAAAIYKYSEDLHDIEDTVLTINRVARVYSPWSSKIYGVSQTSNGR